MHASVGVVHKLSSCNQCGHMVRCMCVCECVMKTLQGWQQPVICVVQLEAKRFVPPFNGVSADSASDAAHLEFRLVDQPIVSAKGSDFTKPLNEVQVTALMTAGLWLANSAPLHSTVCNAPLNTQ